MAHHLTPQERDRIAQLRYQGANQKEIARAVARCPSTISRELRRNSTAGEYYSTQAQWKARNAAGNDHWRERWMIPRSTRLFAGGWRGMGAAADRRTDAAASAPRRVSSQTIYTWIKQDANREHWESFLRRRGKRPYRRKNAATSGDAARIDQRPEVIEERLRLGDFEGDTVLGPAGTGGLATLVDRKSRFTIVVKVQSKNADHVHAKIKQRMKELDEQRRRSITFDNGTEFARCHRLEKHLGMELYFADPGCPYQRGTNENTNGLIRQYFPKGTDFRNVSHSQVRQVENLLNNRPRACLGFRTPGEVFFEKTPPSGCD